MLHMQGASSTATLVFSDFRMFGRVLFHAGDTLPPWWTSIAPAITSSEFTRQCVGEFMKRRSGITIKAALLMQERFPGIGNWMADEILWRSCIHPSKRCGDLTDDEVADFLRLEVGQTCLTWTQPELRLSQRSDWQRQFSRTNNAGGRIKPGPGAPCTAVTLTGSSADWQR